MATRASSHVFLLPRHDRRPGHDSIQNSEWTSCPLHGGVSCHFWAPTSARLDGAWRRRGQTTAKLARVSVSSLKEVGLSSGISRFLPARLLWRGTYIRRRSPWLHSERVRRCTLLVVPLWQAQQTRESELLSTGCHISNSGRLVVVTTRGDLLPVARAAR